MNMPKADSGSPTIQDSQSRRNLRTRRVIAWANFVLSLCVVGWFTIPSFKPAIIYVSPDGSDWNDGKSKDTPLRSINSAVSRIAKSGHIYLLPGTYQERVHVRTGGTPQEPLRIEVTEPEKTKLTWSKRIPDDIEKRWTENKNPDYPNTKIFRTSIEWPVYHVRHNGEWLYRAYFRLNQLEQLASMSNAYGTFHYSDGELFVYLKDGQSPENETIEINGPVPEPTEVGYFGSANIWIESDHVELRGLQCEFGIGSSISIGESQHVSIVDCSFTGTNIGVNASRLPGNKNPDLKVSRCLFHNYPQFLWRRDWLPWREIYAVYSSSSLISAPRGEVEVQDCLVAHAGDGMQITNSDSDFKIRVKNNLLVGCTDDAFELDGDGVNVKISNNVVLNAHQNLGLSPVQEGPCTISGNAFVHTLVRLNGSLVKFWAPDPKYRIQNIEIRDNRFLGNWICYGSRNKIENVSVEDNLVWFRAMKDFRWPAGISESNNHYERMQENVRVVSDKDLLRFMDSTSNVSDLSHAAKIPVDPSSFGPTWFAPKQRSKLIAELIPKRLLVEPNEISVQQD